MEFFENCYWEMETSKIARFFFVSTSSYIPDNFILCQIYIFFVFFVLFYIFQ